ncbi:MAG TPA: lactonase family protein [Bryobacteraceae bacterium]|nr:lactonase family protein [Bryobacteraceae bacterium]
MKYPLRILTGLLLAGQFALPQTMYVGTYTDGTSKGIYAYHFDAKTGALTPMGLMAQTPEPTFLALHPSGKYLYAVNEVNTFQGKKAGSVTAFSIDHSTGKLTQLNQVSTQSPGPCHLIVDATGKTLMVANYAGGSFTSFPIQADGKLGEAASFIQEHGSSVNKQRQSEPHGHSVNLPKNNKFMLGADLGTDQVMIFKLDAANGKITPSDPPSASVKAGSGPRHMAFAPDQKHVYALNEMASAVTTFTYDPATAAMKEIDMTSALPADFNGKSTGAEIEVDSRGKFLYTSNRGLDSIAVFSLDSKTGKPTLIQNQSTGGKTPRGFALDPSGNFLVVGNQDTNTIAVFRVDQNTGKLSPAGGKYDLGSPVTFVFVK